MKTICIVPKSSRNFEKAAFLPLGWHNSWHSACLFGRRRVNWGLFGCPQLVLVHRHRSHQSESLLQSAEGFLKEAASTLGTGGKSCTDNGGHKGVTISTDQSVSEGVGGTYVEVMLLVIWHVWYSRSWSWSLPPPQSWQRRRSLVQGLLWRSVSRSGRSSQTYFRRMSNFWTVHTKQENHHCK